MVDEVGTGSSILIFTYQAALMPKKSFTDCDVLRKNVIFKSSAWHA